MARNGTLCTRRADRSRYHREPSKTISDQFGTHLGITCAHIFPASIAAIAHHQPRPVPPTVDIRQCPMIRLRAGSAAENFTARQQITCCHHEERHQQSWKPRESPCKEEVPALRQSKIRGRYMIFSLLAAARDEEENMVKKGALLSTAQLAEYFEYTSFVLYANMETVRAEGGCCPARPSSSCLFLPIVAAVAVFVKAVYSLFCSAQRCRQT